jgi:UV DNA damage endonuclease
MRARASTHAAVAGPASERPLPCAGDGVDSGPHLGLVCITFGPEIRYRTITRTRFLSLDTAAQHAALEDLYRHNVRTMFNAVDYCRAWGLALYRVTSNLFPQVDHPVGRAVQKGLRDAMSGFGVHAERNGVRVVIHPDQWVVLNSDTPAVAAQSVAILADHARSFDMLGLPRSPWSLMLVHGGKGNRGDALVDAIARLPENVRSRLALENDENCYSASQILDVCRRARVPMVFDAHHHAVREKLDTYEDPSVREMTLAARETWQPYPEWQVVHISNGAASFADPRHSDVISAFPSAFLDVAWVEVEAKHKEAAIEPLRRRLLDRRQRTRKTGRP